ncbi:MAG: signal peptidase II [Chloroflexota bacterium]
MKRFRGYVFLFGVAGLIVALDQWTKWLVRTNLPEGGTWSPEWLGWLSPYARVIHWYNSGAAFGMFQGASTVFAVLAFIVVGAILYYYPRVEQGDWTLRLAMAMQLAGALGNLIDRLLFKGLVTDFISVGTFPVFNVADASISVGVVVLLLGAWVRERKEKQEAGEDNAQSSVTGNSET